MKNFERFKVVGDKPVVLSEFETKFDGGIKDRDLKKQTQDVWS